MVTQAAEAEPSSASTAPDKKVTQAAVEAERRSGCTVHEI
jgi:hypothetical protein